MDITNDIYNYQSYNDYIHDLDVRIADCEDMLNNVNITSHITGMPNAKGGTNSKVENDVDKMERAREEMKGYQKKKDATLHKQRVIDRYLARLSDEHRQVIQLRIFEDKTYATIMEIMGKNNPQNVYALLNSAIKSLGEDYDKTYIKLR